MLTLLLIEQEILRMVIVTMFIYPLEIESLVWVEVWLLYKHCPEPINIGSTQSYLMIWAEDNELKEPKGCFKSFFVSMFSNENVSWDIIRNRLILFYQSSWSFFDSSMIPFNIANDSINYINLLG